MSKNGSLRGKVPGQVIYIMVSVTGASPLTTIASSASTVFNPRNAIFGLAFFLTRENSFTLPASACFSLPIYQSVAISIGYLEVTKRYFLVKSKLMWSAAFWKD